MNFPSLNLVKGHTYGAPVIDWTHYTSIDLFEKLVSHYSVTKRDNALGRVINNFPSFICQTYSSKNEVAMVPRKLPGSFSIDFPARSSCWFWYKKKISTNLQIWLSLEKKIPNKAFRRDRNTVNIYFNVICIWRIELNRPTELPNAVFVVCFFFLYLPYAALRCHGGKAIFPL